MTRLLLFLLALVLFLFLVLYSELTWQLIVVYGKKKIVLNFWFAILVLLLMYLSVHWVIRKLSFFFQIPDMIRRYRWERRLQEKEYARGQAIIYGLTGNYQAALGHLPYEKDQELSDLILRAIWLNQLQDIQALDQVLAKMVALNKIPDGWMIWFRAHLLQERGKGHLATDMLLDAIESKVYTAQIVQSFVDYADPKVHFQAMLSHAHLLSRYVKEDHLWDKIKAGAKLHMNPLVAQKKWNELESVLQSLPRKLRQDPGLHYYWMHKLISEGHTERLKSFLMTASFADERMIPLLANVDLPMDTKIEIVSKGLSREPDNKNLLYLSSYLHAQSGDIEDMVKRLETAMSKT